MDEIYLKLPKHKKSKRNSELMNAEGEIVGRFKRTLKNKKQVFLDIIALYELVIINFDIFNKFNELTASIEGDFTYLRKPTWTIKNHNNNQVGTIKQSSLLKSKSFKVFDITLDDQLLQLKSTSSGEYIFISNNEIIATMKDIDKSKIFAENYKINFNCDQDWALLLTTIFYLFLITS